jgi:hypothetical protein
VSIVAGVLLTASVAAEWKRPRFERATAVEGSPPPVHAGGDFTQLVARRLVLWRRRQRHVWCLPDSYDGMG